MASSGALSRGIVLKPRIRIRNCERQDQATFYITGPGRTHVQPLILDRKSRENDDAS